MSQHSNEFEHPKLKKVDGPRLPNSYIIWFVEGISEEDKEHLIPLDEFVQFYLFDFDQYSSDSEDSHDEEHFFRNAVDHVVDTSRRRHDPTYSKPPVYNAAAGILPTIERLEFVVKSPMVRKVYENGLINIHGSEENSSTKSQSNAPWGISRLSSSSGNLQPPNAMQSRFVYQYKDTSPTEPVDVYVVDTGIFELHTEFKPRKASNTTTRVGHLYRDSDHTDCHGHGTHVAGTIGGVRYGVAKTCNLISVKIMTVGNGTCPIFQVFWALFDILDEAYWRYYLRTNSWPFSKEDITELRSVVNLSIVGPRSELLDWAVRVVTLCGIHVVVAAGNQGKDSATFSPAGSEFVITVGASTITDSLAWFSNYGPLVDVYAPGVFINSAIYWPAMDKDNTTETAMMSGTSMACAHVSGLVAYLLQVEGPRSPEAMKARVIELALKDVIKDFPSGSGSNNRLANFSVLMK